MERSTIMSTLLTVADVGFRRNKRADWLFRHLGFTVASGEMVAVLGRSGSGKSTLFNLLAGFAKPAEGRIQRNGEISVVLQEFLLYQDLTVAENLDFFSKINDCPQNLERWIEMSGLNRWEKSRAANLPLGYKKMLQVIVALTRECQLLILDDTVQGMDEATKTELNLLLKEMTEAGLGVLYIGSEQPCPGFHIALNLQDNPLSVAPVSRESYPRGGVGVKL
jgi:ABC-type multidrug transport system ATPase subunit